MVQIITVNDSSFEEIKKNYQGLLLVDFYADWCGPCRVLSKVLDVVIDEYAKVDDDKFKIVKLNVDESPNTAAEMKVTTIPSLFMYNQGEEVWKHVGSASYDLLKEQIDKYIKI